MIYNNVSVDDLLAHLEVVNPQEEQKVIIDALHAACNFLNIDYYSDDLCSAEILQLSRFVHFVIVKRNEAIAEFKESM